MSKRIDLLEIVAAAKSDTGLDDMGQPDILPGMRVLIDAYRNEACLRADGIEGRRASLIHALATRLRIEDYFKQHPEIANERILGPIVITGLPRSGTTKMQRMMGSDPGLQKLPLWKILNLVPVGSPAAGEDDPRIQIAEQVSAMMLSHFPDFYAGHPMLSCEPDEEEFFMDLVMRGYLSSHSARTPSFENWMDLQDFGVWYPYLKKVLQLQQWFDGSPSKPWVLKAPSHLRHVHLLFQTFPDATVVHCHRDPVTAITSFAALVEASRRMSSDRDDPKEAGAFTLGHWAKQMRGYLAQRPQLESRHRFVDVAYRDIIKDPLCVIARVYQVAGLVLTEEARATMRAWESDNSLGKHGSHQYAMNRYGFSADEIRREFSDYLARYGDLVEM